MPLLVVVNLESLLIPVFPFLVSFLDKNIYVLSVHSNVCCVAVREAGNFSLKRIQRDNNLWRERVVQLSGVEVDSGLPCTGKGDLGAHRSVRSPFWQDTTLFTVVRCLQQLLILPQCISLSVRPLILVWEQSPTETNGAYITQKNPIVCVELVFRKINVLWNTHGLSHIPKPGTLSAATSKHTTSLRRRNRNATKGSKQQPQADRTAVLQSRGVRRDSQHALQRLPLHKYAVHLLFEFFLRQFILAASASQCVSAASIRPSHS